MAEKSESKQGRHLFTLWGIPVVIDITILFPFLVYPMASLPDWEMALSVFVKMIVLYTIVTVHELGHAVVARLFGAKVGKITLMVLGGVCTIDLPDNLPKHMLAISIAGPFVNLVLATVSLSLALLSGDAIHFDYGFSMYNSYSPLNFLVVFNIGMVLINLIPIGPLDGGRILKAILHIAFGHRPAILISLVISLGILVIGSIAVTRGGNNIVFIMLIAFLTYNTLIEAHIGLKRLRKSAPTEN